MKKNKSRIVYLLALIVGLMVPIAQAQEDYFEMDLDHLGEVELFQANVLSAHLHKESELMLSYTYMRMEMDGNRDGTDRLSAAEILDPNRGGFLVTPINMNMNMHMFNIMYSVSDDLTLMVMIPYWEKSMNHLTRSGASFQTRSKGLGDLMLSGNYIAYRKETDLGEDELFVSLGVSLPTGAIDEKDNTAASNGRNVQLPYPMQLGSGTYDLDIGLGYLSVGDPWFWGIQGNATIRLEDENKNNYRLGNRFSLKSWVTRSWGDSLSTFLRLDGVYQKNIHGADPDLNPAVVSTADPNRRAQKTLSISIGADVYATETVFERSRISFEVGRPIYQDFDGPQLETDWTTSFSIQYIF